MAVKFVLNKKHIAYIDETILKKYRDIMNIPPERKNSRVIRDVMYKKIFETDYYMDEIDSWVKSLQMLTELHAFKNPGELIEYFMHKEIENKLALCKNCNKYKDGLCLLEGLHVSGNGVACDVPNEAFHAN